MSAPLFTGMPPVDTRFTVPRTGTMDPKDTWGNIRCGGPCKDDSPMLPDSFGAGSENFDVSKKR